MGCDWLSDEEIEPTPTRRPSKRSVPPPPPIGPVPLLPAARAKKNRSPLKDSYTNVKCNRTTADLNPTLVYVLPDRRISSSETAAIHPCVLLRLHITCPMQASCPRSPSPHLPLRSRLLPHMKKSDSRFITFVCPSAADTHR